MAVEMNRENFDSATSRKGITLVRCWAPWCGSCEESAESYRRAAGKHPGNLFATLDTQEQKELRASLGIQHVPGLLVYRDGVLLFQQPGSFDEATLADIIAQAESLDMELVRAEIASPKSGSAA